MRQILDEIRRRKASRTPEEARAEQERWLRENKEAIESANAWVEEHGLPLERYRLV